jgi:hypothetical protein
VNLSHDHHLALETQTFAIEEAVLRADLLSRIRDGSTQSQPAC